MKSERRHELQTNSLATFLARTPDFMRAHGSKVLLGVIIVLLVAILIHQRTRRNQEQLDSGWTSIATARQTLQAFPDLPRRVSSADQLAQARKQIVEAADATLNPLLGSDNRQIAAQAYLLKGDLYWTLANTPEVPEATTRPALKINSNPDENLTKAGEAYEKVIHVYADNNLAATNARFGLAAIAENRREFDQAAKLYNEIKSDDKTIPSYKTLADMRLAALDLIKAPVYLTPATTQSAPATQPATAPASAVEAK